MRKKHRVRLTAEERTHLLELIGHGSCPARKQRCAHLLLKLDEGDEGPAWTGARAAEAMEVSTASAASLCRKFAIRGLEGAVNRKKPDREYERKMDGEREADLVRLVCSAPPEGRSQWSLRLLADQMVELGHVESLSHNLAVRVALKKTGSSLTKRSSG